MTDERLDEIGQRAAALAFREPGNRWTTDVFELIVEVRRLRAGVAAEREACAKVAEEHEPSAVDYRRADALEVSAWDLAATGIAAAIRSRS